MRVAKAWHLRPSQWDESSPEDRAEMMAVDLIDAMVNNYEMDLARSKGS